MRLRVAIQARIDPSVRHQVIICQPIKSVSYPSSVVSDVRCCWWCALQEDPSSQRPTPRRRRRFAPLDASSTLQDSIHEGLRCHSPCPGPGPEHVPTRHPIWGHFDIDEEELDNIDFSDRDDIYQDDDDCNFYNPALGYATAALDHYNTQDMNKIKYELVEAIISGGTFVDARAYYVHVNFAAKSTLHNSIFFAELYLDEDRHVFVPTCIVSLEGQESVGGIRGVEGVYYDEENILVYNRLCHACPQDVKHPKDGSLCEAGHRKRTCYGHCCS